MCVQTSGLVPCVPACARRVRSWPREEADWTRRSLWSEMMGNPEYHISKIIHSIHLDTLTSGAVACV